MTEGGRSALRDALLTPMLYHLPPHLSFGLVGPRAVLLDLAADRYQWLGEAETAAILAIGSAASLPYLEALSERGIVRPGSGNRLPVAAVPLHESALESLLESDALPVLEVAQARLGAALWLRFAGLRRTMARWRRLRASVHRKAAPGREHGNAAGRAGDIARGYARSRVFVPAPRLCVPDSLALLRCLWRRGIDADLYFGVRLSPFAAHCWIAKDEVLLTDPLNIVADYTPVFRL